MANLNITNNAYSKALDQLKNAPTAKSDASSSVFGDLVKNSISSAIDAQYKSEQISTAALTGKADMTDVIEAVGNAELALNTVMAVRDKVINAYESIIHMAI